MDVVYILISSLFFLWVVRDMFYWVAMWQHNEYRPDRFFAEVNDKKQRRPLLYGLIAILKIVLLLGFLYIALHDGFLIYYQYAVASLFFLQAFFIGREIYSNNLKKPKLTARVILIIFLTFITILVLFELQLMDRFFWLLLIDFLISFIVGLYVFLFSFPIELYGDWQIERAMKKLRSNRDLLIIGVTGSYGKSIVKDTIAHVLEFKYKVIKTKDADNTLVGISETILRNLESDTEIFVAEMSAYKRGEIAALCRYVRPKIGVLTGINNHYLPVFRTMDNLKKTNFELVESLPKTGFCVFNGNNKYTTELYSRSKKQKVIYSTKDTHKYVPQDAIMASNILHKGKRLSFDIQINDTYMHFTLNTHQTLESLLPAIYLANYLGMSELEIKKALAGLK